MTEQGSTEVKAGGRFSDAHGNMRVMAIAQGYAMCRRTGKMPFVLTVAEVAVLMNPSDQIEREVERRWQEILADPEEAGVCIVDLGDGL